MIHPAVLFLSELTWVAIGAVGSAVAAIAALAAVLLAVPALRLNAKSLQLNALNSIFNDIRQLDHVWVESGRGDGMTERQREAWCASFFNTVEYLCFLTNRKLVPQVELREFFDLALPLWWNQFVEYKMKGLLTDTTSSFTEFKATCKRLKLPGAEIDS